MAKKAARTAKKVARKLGAAAQAPTGSPGTVRVTYPGGRVAINPDDGRAYPPGTMLQWADRWTIVGTAWPFDD